MAKKNNLEKERYSVSILNQVVSKEAIVKTAPIEANLETVNYGFLPNVIRRNNRI